MTTIQTYAIVRNGVVINTILWDGASDWGQPEGATGELLPENSLVSVGYKFDGTDFSAPAVVVLPLTLVQQAQEAMTVGLQIVSTGTSALNGTYAIDQLSQMDIIAIETSLNAGKGFPGGATVFNYADTAGVMHSFTAANFTDFAAAVRDYVYALKSVIAGASATLPAAASPIA